MFKVLFSILTCARWFCYFPFVNNFIYKHLFLRLKSPSRIPNTCMYFQCSLFACVELKKIGGKKCANLLTYATKVRTMIVITPHAIPPREELIALLPIHSLIVARWTQLLLSWCCCCCCCLLLLPLVWKVYRNFQTLLWTSPDPNENGFYLFLCFSLFSVVPTASWSLPNTHSERVSRRFTRSRYIIVMNQTVRIIRISKTLRTTSNLDNLWIYLSFDANTLSEFRQGFWSCLCLWIEIYEREKKVFFFYSKVLKIKVSDKIINLTETSSVFVPKFTKYFQSKTFKEDCNK